MTDEQIVKALCDCEGVDGISYCNSCPLYEEDNCVHILSKEAKDLINRQKAEIELKTMDVESLTNERDALQTMVAEQKAENDELKQELFRIKTGVSSLIKELGE